MLLSTLTFSCPRIRRTATPATRHIDDEGRTRVGEKTESYLPVRSQRSISVPVLPFAPEAVEALCRGGHQHDAQESSILRRCQPAIQLIGKRLSIFGAEVGRSSNSLSSAAKLIQEIPNGQALTDVGIRVQFTSRVEGLPTSGDHFCG